MRIRYVLLGVVALMAPTAAGADDHWADINAAYSYAEGSKLWRGVYFALGITAARNDPSRWERVSVIGDFSFHEGDNNAGANITRISFAVGGRIWANPNPGANRVFAQATIGGVHNRTGTVETTNRALTMGVGYEFHLAGNQPAGFATRVQVDYQVVNNATDRPRASVGIVYRFD